MSEPLLTIGIPTQGKRPDRLAKAIGSALAQTTPARVVVADQDGGAADALTPYAGHPLVTIVRTEANCLWANWTAAAEACETPYFAWLQDDDLVAPHFAHRVEAAFRRFPDAQAWIARLGISRSPGLANWWEASGPALPMDLLHGSQTEIDGAFLVVGAYLTSHALSPAVAFRATPETIQAVRNVPSNADLFAERSILVELGRLGPCVVDPAIVGYWVHHDGNESRAQNLAGDGPRQFAIMCEHVDPILETTPRWEGVARGWLMMAGAGTVKHYHDSTRGHDPKSPHLARLRAMCRDLYPSIEETAADKAAQREDAA